MKNFFKKIAFVLALAMVFSNIAPAASASAAAAPSLKYTSKVIYVGDDALGMYSDSCWTPSQNTSGYTVAYSTKSTIIDVAKNGKITANGTGIGKAVVAVTYSKAGVKDITANFTVKVRRNAETVRLTNASAELLANAMKVGDSLTLDAAKSINGSYAKGNYGLNNYMGVCSDQLILVSSNEEVVKVNGMNIEAVGVGEATITVKAVQYMQNEETGVVSKAYDVVVVGGLQSAKLVSTTKVELGFASPVSKDEVKVGTIVMKDANGVDISNYIKGVSYSDDLKTVTVETFVAFVDKAAYSFEVDGSVAELTAVINDVAEVRITGPSKVAANVTTAIEYKFYDENGVELAASEDMKARVSFTLADATSAAWVNGKDITVFDKGLNITVKGEYATGKYDDSYNEIKIAIAPYTFQSVESVAATVTGFDAAAVTKGTTDNGSDFTGKMTVPAESDGFYLSIKAKKSDGNAIYSKNVDNGIRFESTDSSRLFVETTTGKLIPLVASGTVSVLVTCGDVKRVYDVTIGAKEVLGSIAVDKASLALTNADVPVAAEGTITLTAKSNYDFKFNISASDVNVEKISGNGTEPTINKAQGDTNQVKLEVNAIGATNGTFQYRVKVGDKAIIVSIVVQDGTGAATSYRFVSAKSEVDTKVTANSGISGSGPAGTEYAFDISAVGYNAKGVAVCIATSAAITVKNSNGTVIYQQTTGASTTVLVGGAADADTAVKSPTNNGSASTITVNAITGASASKADASTYQKIATGKYTVEGYVVVSGGSCESVAVGTTGTSVKTIVPTTFTIVNNQSVPSIELIKPQLKSSAGELDLAAAFKVGGDNNWTITAMETAAHSGLVTAMTIDPTAVNAGTYGILVKTITFTETITDGSNTAQVEHKVTVNKNISFVK